MEELIPSDLLHRRASLKEQRAGFHMMHIPKHLGISPSTRVGLEGLARMLGLSREPHKHTI
jgi:hypothetical protein